MTNIDLKKWIELLQKIDSGEIELEKEKIFKKNIKEVYEKKKQKYEFLKNNNWMLWPTTPFPEIDKITKWFKKWWLVWIGAFSNTWKSQLSYFYAQYFLKQWLEVAYFSLEVAGEDVLTMITQYYYKVSYKEWARKENNWAFDKLNIYDVSDYYKLSDIEKYVLKYKPDIVFIDFIQILEMEWSTEYERLSSWIRRLQRLAIDTNTTIIYLSQVSNVDNKEKDVLQVWLKWTWDLIASSDYVFIMKKSRINNTIVFALKKNKHWPAYKTFSLYFDFENWECNYDWERIQEDNQLF